jgi:hypothetical protein
MPLDDRERSFENALARHLRPSGTPGACSDAETLAAYHEQSLGPEVMASLKAHVSECERCQQILAQLQATDEIPLASDIAKPQAAAAKPGVRVIPARKPTLWRWVAPAGALAAALLVWVAVHENKLERFSKLPSSGDAKPTEIARAEPSSVPPLPPPSLDATANSERVAADTFSPTDRVQPSRSKIAPATQADAQSLNKEKNFDGTRKPSSAATGFAGAAAKLVTPSAPAPVLEPTPPRSVAQTVTVAPAPDAVVTNQAARGELAKNETEAKAANEKRDAAYSRSASPTSAVGGAAPAPAEPAPQQSSESVQVSAESSATTALHEHGRPVSDLNNLNPQAQLLLAGGGAAVTVSAPDGRASWRIGPGGVILFSSDGGKSWLVQPSGTITDLLAGSAPSDKVCWIVGRSGTILRTSDRGKHWKKVTPPTQDDLRSVFAANDHQATVSPANGAYQTSDGGATWKPLPRE